MNYEQKFHGLIEAIQQAKAKNASMILVQSPQIIGDNYKELVESLNRISSAGLALHIVPPKERRRSDPSRN